MPDTLTTTETRVITLTAEDLDQIIRENGVDPDSITTYEWSKFTDAFLEGTHWSEIAGYAAEDLVNRREMIEP